MAEATNDTRRLLVRPASAVSETRDGRIQVLLEMPGVRQENLEIRIEGNELRVLGRRGETESYRYLARERRPGDFFMSWTLDETIDQGKVDAVLRQGMLTLTLDLKEQVKPRTVRIRGE